MNNQFKKVKKQCIIVVETKKSFENDVNISEF